MSKEHKIISNFSEAIANNKTIQVGIIGEPLKSTLSINRNHKHLLAKS